MRTRIKTRLPLSSRSLMDNLFERDILAIDDCDEDSVLKGVGKNHGESLVGGVNGLSRMVGQLKVTFWRGRKSTAGTDFVLRRIFPTK